MNNPFGQFSDDSTQAFNEAMAERFDFKQCQRSDGTIYGVPDKSNCAQKGAKEFKKDAKAAQGVEWYIRAMNRYNKDAKDLNFDKLSDAELKSAINGLKGGDNMSQWSVDNGDLQISSEKIGKIIKTLSDRSKAEGKGAVSVSSLLSKRDLKFIGSDPKSMKAFLKGLGVGENSPEMKKATAIIDKMLAPQRKAQAEAASKAKADAKAAKAKSDAKAKADAAAKAAKTKSDAKAKADAKAKPAAKPKAKPKSRYSYEDNRKQYKVFYNMVRNQGLGHGDAAVAAEDAMRASGFDPGDISNQYRKQVREAF